MATARPFGINLSLLTSYAEATLRGQLLRGTVAA
ncbi:RRNA intron-encoded homing endonuclease [Senna tora]|uniref:rRNA intron-encoded homing endonuclease n=1 Tax=Senna tora TaxID=362788 RepID=A0A834TNS8_9FABA|nr:RRNA intron-encoded homing endonuclease [Senna tora]